MNPPLTSGTYSSIHTQERQSPHLLIEDDDDVILQVDDVIGHVTTEAAIVLPSSSSRRLADLLQVRYIIYTTGIGRLN